MAQTHTYTRDDTVEVADLFSGTKAFSRAFEESDRYNVTTLDIQPVQFNGKTMEPDIEMNILDARPEDLPDADIVLASPPCTSFSMGSIGHHWHKQSERVRTPTSKTGLDGVKMVYHALWLIEELDPAYWFLENPRAGLRKVLGTPQHDARQEWKSNERPGDPPGEITWCQYWTDRDREERGVPVMKPTDLWGTHPESFEYRRCSNGSDCHESAVRGSKTGTQGRANSDVRGSIPWGISKEIKEAVDRELFT